MPSPKSQDKPFAHYARYYDLIYNGKDYVAETQFVDGQLRALGSVDGSLLELGCGTGRHAAAFAELGWNVSGVDISPAMVVQARQRARTLRPGIKKKLSFSVGDMAKVRTGKTYDAVISLFHVMGYQTSNGGLLDALKTAAAHLRPGGLFFFDFWFGPAVLTDRPDIRVKHLEDSRIAVTRISRPVMDMVHNTVSIDFDVMVEDKRTRRLSRITESHRVRYFFIPELQYFLEAAGFKIESHGRWMTNENLDSNSWYGWIMARLQ